MCVHVCVSEGGGEVGKERERERERERRIGNKFKDKVKKIAGNIFREKLFQRNYVFGKFYFNISKFRSCVIHICSKSNQFYHAH